MRQRHVVDEREVAIGPSLFPNGALPHLAAETFDGASQSRLDRHRRQEVEPLWVLGARAREEPAQRALEVGVRTVRIVLGHNTPPSLENAADALGRRPLLDPAEAIFRPQVETHRIITCIGVCVHQWEYGQLSLPCGQIVSNARHEPEPSAQLLEVRLQCGQSLVETEKERVPVRNRMQKMHRLRGEGSPQHDAINVPAAGANRHEAFGLIV
mmetsp:Transcript_53304/g.148231  ORF Transcript_53304/g.148231 Transcript_53304/m.148231 type:complete len:212 (-) Transcript_53304:606-1241(-)